MALAEGHGPREIRALREKIHRRVRPAGRVPAPRGPAQARPVALSQPYDDDGIRGVPAPARPGGLGRPRGHPRPVGRAAAVDRERVGHQDQRPAAGRCPGRGLPPRRRRGRGGTGHGEGGGVRDDGLPGPGRADRCGHDADRGPAGTGDGAPDGLRRGHHPGRPRLAGRGPRPRPDGAAGDPKQVQALWIRDKGCTFPGCSRPPSWCDAHHCWHWCDGGPTDLSNLASALPAAPHDRAPARLHRHHHRVRGDLAPAS